jgi:CheY-like chemotaxis protein
VETAGNGLIALNYMLQNTSSLPNLLLVDLQMPVMDGFELIANLREVNVPANPMLVACSADWATETDELCYDVGFENLLRKPITFTDIKTFLVRTARDNPERFAA